VAEIGTSVDFWIVHDTLSYLRNLCSITSQPQYLRYFYLQPTGELKRKVGKVRWVATWALAPGPRARDAIHRAD